VEWGEERMGSHMEQSSIAYSYHADIGSMSWGGNLIDIQQFSNGGLDLYVLVAHTELGIDYVINNASCYPGLAFFEITLFYLTLYP